MIPSIIDHVQFWFDEIKNGFLFFSCPTTLRNAMFIQGTTCFEGCVFRDFLRLLENLVLKKNLTAFKTTMRLQ